MPHATDIDWTPVFEDTEGIEQLIGGQIGTLASVCLLYYDYFLTLQDEVRLVWHTRLSIATVLFLAIRYGFLMLVTMTAVLDVQFGQVLTPSSCRSMTLASTTLELAVFAMVSAFVALRISAIWSRNWLIGISLFFMGLANPTSMESSLFYGFTSTRIPLPVGACLQRPPADRTLWVLEITDFPMAFSAISIVYELTCLFLTLVKTLGNYHQGRRAGVSTPLSTLLIRDGSLYFVVFTILALFDIATAVNHHSKIPDGQVSIFSRSLTPILVTRFIARIRQIDDAQDTTCGGTETCAEHTPGSALEFRGRFIGSVSGSLDFDSDAYCFEDGTDRVTVTEGSVLQDKPIPNGRPSVEL